MKPSLYQDSNVSLGGTYLTLYWSIARTAATLAGREHRSKPVVLLVRVKFPLFPDEDWVAKAAENPHQCDVSGDIEDGLWRDPRYQEFFDDLFSEYLGESHSLSDEYVRRYDELNESYNITWRDGFRYTGSVRQDHLLTLDQVVKVHDL